MTSEMRIGGLKSRLVRGQHRVHLLDGERAVACYPGPVRGALHASTDPLDVTCPHCRLKLRQQGRDLVAMDLVWSARETPAKLAVK